MNINKFRYWLVIRWWYPVIILVSKIFPESVEKWEKKFIQWNNRLVLAEKVKLTNAELLILLPHCLQNVDCTHRITYNVLNCAQCGKCPVSEIVKLGEKYSLNIKVATGGRLAQRWVRDYKPALVIACACEHELMDGISAVYPLKVLAVPNEQPEGPCRNTDISVGNIEKAVKAFL